MAKYEVKLVTSGPDAGRWGVYRDGMLQKAFNKKGSATGDMRRRKREERPST